MEDNMGFTPCPYCKKLYPFLLPHYCITTGKHIIIADLMKGKKDGLDKVHLHAN